jgi:tetratricopeptide (TPR) repeat protein
MYRKLSYLLLCLSILVLACSSERNTFTNRLYHNTTAKYNAYYLAKGKILELESTIQSGHQEDFSQILPIFYPIDSGTIDQNKELLIDAKDLASKAIDWHRISKWKDDSYFLLGMIDYYQADFDDALNTFKYVNVNGKDKNLRHQSLIQLLRMFVDLKKFDDATFVIDYLSKESGINRDNKFLLYKTLAYFYENRGESNGKIGALDKALDYAKDNKERSRINFILAQLYQREDLDALAYNYYQEAQKGNPPYERSFFAQLYAQQVAELNKSKDLRRVRAYYDDLYKDSKNRELRDVILYEKALFELKQGEVEEAEVLLTKAAKEIGANPIQKGYIYLKLADIRFELKEDYHSTKYYIDSALTYFKVNDLPYEGIIERKDILDNYVIHLEKVTLNDSLISLSRLSKEEQEKIAENYIKGEEERLLKLAADKEKPKSSGIFDNLLALSGRSGGENFYFDNALARQQGAIDFFRNWGNRPLQDNWRRSSQGFQSSLEGEIDNEEIVLENEQASEDLEDIPLMSQIPDKETLLAQIPSSGSVLASLNQELETSYFELGKSLLFDFSKPKLSIDYLDNLIEEYPNTVKKPEAYYMLYLAQKEIEGNPEKYLQLLNQEFPDSPFTFSLNNPEGSSGNLAYLESSKKHKEAYDLYYSKKYQESRDIIRTTLEAYPLTRNTEKLLLLDVMISGKLDEREKYQVRLENYIQNTEDPGLLKMARNMHVALTGENPDQEISLDSVEVATSTADQPLEIGIQSGEEENEDISPYKENPDQTHIFVIVLEPKKASESKGLLADLENFHAVNFENSRLRTGNMNLNPENTIFIISPFNNAERALDYREKFRQNFNTEALDNSDKENSFLISIENFQELNKNKNIEEYKVFYKKTYQ